MLNCFIINYDTKGEGYGFSKHTLMILNMRKEIKEKWIWDTIEKPSMKIIVSNREMHLFRKIDEFGGKVLKVVVNPESKLIITAFFDRRIRI